MDLISIVVPCYNEQEAIPIFYESIKNIADKLKTDASIELIFVDDGSNDTSCKIVKTLSETDSIVKYICFSRNFGKESAIYAGLIKAKGDYIAVMDVDMQDPPDLLIEMYYSIINDGYDCVAARRISRQGEPAIRSACSRFFYKLINKISNIEIVDGARDYRLMTRQMVDSVLRLKEINRFSKGIFGWVGYKTKWIEYENIERTAGETKWSFWKLFLYALDGIIAFSVAPLSIASVFGILFCAVSFVIICIVIIKTLIWGDPVAGYPSLICVIFFIGGIQLFCIGILSQYLSKIYLETKGRPIYIIKEENK